MKYRTAIRKQTEAAINPIIQALNQVIKEPEADEDSYSSVMNAIDEQRYLRAYVDSWVDADCNFYAWCKKNPDISSNVKQYVSGYACTLEAGNDGRAILSTRPTTNSLLGISAAGEVCAIRYFLRIIQSPLFDSIGRCERCGNYFLNASGHQDRKYCSRACATGRSALKSVRAKREKDRKEKVKKVRNAIHEYKQLKIKSSDWKEWVAERSGLSQKWITQAFNRGDLPNAKSLIESKGAKANAKDKK